MTSIMPFPKKVTLDDAFKPLGELQSAVKATESKPKINEGHDLFAKFHSALDTGSSFTDAVMSLIREQDGTYYPFAVGGDFAATTPESARSLPVASSGGGAASIIPPWMPTTRNEAKEQFDNLLYNMAGQLDQGLRDLQSQVLNATKDNKLSGDEASSINAFITYAGSAKNVLGSMFEERAKLGGPFDKLQPWQVYENIIGKVNSRGNDLRGGPFGTWTKLGVGEAKDFIETLQGSNLPAAKQKAVLEEVFNTASSAFGNLVLDAKAVDQFKTFAENDLGLTGLDWNSAINVAKEDHPIVALYAVSIRDAMNASEPNVRELETMLRAGNAALRELSVDFVRNGPRTLGNAEMPAASLAFAGPSALPARAQNVSDLSKALKDLEAMVKELKG
jgi:hypothetical protein